MITEFFSNTFEANSDRARLIAIIISAVIAIAIFTLSQYFTNKRNKKDLLIKKAEEFALLSLDFISSCADLVRHYKNLPLENRKRDLDIDLPKIEETNQLLRKMEMISLLYFPKYKFSAEDYAVSNILPIIKIAFSKETFKQDEINEEFAKSLLNIKNSRRQLNDISKKIMKKYIY